MPFHPVFSFCDKRCSIPSIKHIIIMRILTSLMLLLFACNLSAQNYIRVDFSKPSSTKRFVVYTPYNTELFSCKCAHGQGGKSTRSKPEISNKVGSNCSSVGKFQIVGFYVKGDIKYLRLKGLSSTNSNALRRGICIHNSKMVTSWKWIPFFNLPLSNASNGCFAIDNESMDKVIKLYQQRKLKYLYAVM